MNHIYRLIWNHKTQSLTAVAENATGRGKNGGRAKTLATAVAGAMLALGPGLSMAADVCISTTNTINTVQTQNDNCVLDAGESVVLQSGAVIQSATTGINPVLVAAGASAGNLTNSGTISITANDWAVNISGAGTTLSGVVNHGLISSSNAVVSIANRAILRQIFNDGTLQGTTGIIASKGGGFAGEISQGVTNAGIISTGNGGGVVATGATISGGILNYGTISSANSGGIVSQWGGLISGGVTNTGTISGNTAGIIVRSTSSVSSGVTNSGLISGNQNKGILIASSSTLSGGIKNLLGGSISGASGLNIWSGSRVADGVVNDGHIFSTATVSTNVNGVALSVDYGSLLEGGITNSGSITGGGRNGFFGRGIDVGYFTASTVAGGLINSGVISAGWSAVDISRPSQIQGGVNNVSGGLIAASGPAISLWSGSAIVSGLTNAGTVSGGTLNGPSGFSNAAIYLSLSTISGGVNNSGTITGGHFGIYADASSTISGGLTISGTISGGDYAINVNATSNLDSIVITGISSALIGDVKAMSANAVVKSDATFANTNAFDIGSFTVESAGLFNFGNGPHTTGGLATNGVKVANGFTNSGTVAISAAAASTVAGSYTQSSTGIFRTGVSASSLGKLTVSDTVTLPPNANFDVVTGDAASCRGITLGGTIAGVITATGALTWNDTSIVTDDCTSLNFEARRSAGNSKVIDLVAVAPPPSVSGGCGTASGLASAFVPVAGLCTTGTSSLVTAAAGGYSWSCAGTNGGATAQCLAPGVTTAGGTGTYRSTFELVSGTGCVVRRASVQPPPSGGPGTNVQMPYGVLDFTLESCTPGGMARVRMTYSGSIEGMQFYKYINANWVQLTTVSALTNSRDGEVVINGNTATFNIQDNGAYDADSTLGVIVDPGGPGFAPSNTNPQSIPTLSEWAMIALSGLLGLFGLATLRRRR